VKAVSALIVAGVILAALVSMNLAGGPFHDVVGTVQALSHANGGGRPQVATVALADGRVVQAAVMRPGDAVVGQSVHVRVYHPFLSGDTDFEVLRTKDSATK